MKKVVLLSLVATSLFLFSCSRSKEDIVRRNVEAVLVPSMNNPRSYEFVSIELIDALSNLRILDHRIVIYNLQKELETVLINTNKLDLEYLGLRRSLRHLRHVRFDRFDAEEYEKLRKDVYIRESKVERYERVVYALTGLKRKYSEHLSQSVSYTFRFVYRGQNAMGATVLNSIYVQTDTSPEFGLLNLAERSGELLFSAAFMTPVLANGYAEILARYPEIN